MAQQSAASCNIENRSPWRVQARSKPNLDKRFPVYLKMKKYALDDSLESWRTAPQH